MAEERIVPVDSLILAGTPGVINRSRTRCPVAFALPSRISLVAICIFNDAHTGCLAFLVVYIDIIETRTLPTGLIKQAALAFVV